jgi:hypothetical protein
MAEDYCLLAMPRDTHRPHVTLTLHPTNRTPLRLCRLLQSPWLIYDPRILLRNLSAAIQFRAVYRCA